MKRRLVLVVAGLMVLGCKGKGGGAAVDGDAALAAANAIDAAAAPASRAPPTIVLEEVEVRLHGAAEPALAPRELARELGRCLMDGETIVALPSQVPAGREPRPARMRVEVAAPVPAGGHVMTVVMDAQVAWAHGDDPAPAATVTGEATPGRGGHDAAVLAVVDRLRDTVCADLGNRIRIWGADDLMPFVRGDDPGAAHFALVLLAHRGPTPGAVEAVIPHLRGAPPLRDAAITALVALGDAAAVPALTELTDLADKTALTTIVEAVIAIGGDDARDYLSVMASHRDPAIAKHAREGIARLDRRAAAALPP